MAKNTALTTTTTNRGITDSQWKAIGEITPADKIKTRPGRGGKEFRYVETSYIIELLNKTFNGLWDFTVEDQQVGASQVWVRGILTVKLAPNLEISKTQYGGSDIKMSQGKSIDVADDLKAAASDCLKKCASLMGFAADIYSKPAEESEDSPTISNRGGMVTNSQVKYIYTLISKSPDVNADDLKKELGVESMNDLTFEQASKLIDKLSGKGVI